VGVSQTTAKVGIPPDTAAGPHTIRMPGTDVLTRSVQGIFRGSFQITYSLSAPGCGR
jgi:hypothetical protein